MFPALVEEGVSRFIGGRCFPLYWRRVFHALVEEGDLMTGVKGYVIS